MCYFVKNPNDLSNPSYLLRSTINIDPAYDSGCSGCVHDPEHEGTELEYRLIEPCSDAQRETAVGKTYYKFSQVGEPFT